MIITNNHHLPDTLFRAIIAMDDDYTGPKTSEARSISASGLAAPPRQVVLRRRHDKELVVDASDLLFMLIGKTAHAILEKYSQAVLVEKRIETTYKGWLISGEIDEYDVNGTLRDWKTTSAWSVSKDKDEWIQQVNVYAWLLRRELGFHPQNLEIAAILKDHSDRHMTTSAYPPIPFATVEVELWTESRQYEWIHARLAQLESAERDLPNCSPSDRWENAAGEPRRCPKYCLLRDHCTQWLNDPMNPRNMDENTKKKPLYRRRKS